MSGYRVWGFSLVLTLGPGMVSPASAGTWYKVYQNDFQGSVGTEWSPATTSTTPAGARRFLGQFNKAPVTLTLAPVRLHGTVRLSFDLFIIGSWDGNYVSATAGPDVFDISEQGGPTIIHTTPPTPPLAGQHQAYPGTYPEAGAQYPSNTGAAEVNTLGYPCSGSCTNAVYHVDVTYAHRDDAINLIFSAPALESIDNESWGIDNVAISIETPPPPDFDGDGDLDQFDMMYFMACAAGPGVPYHSFPGCHAADMDGDGDADSTDFATLQRCYSGEGKPSNPDDCGL